MKDITTYLQYLTNIEHVFSEELYVGGEEVLDSAKISFTVLKQPLFKFTLNHEGTTVLPEIILKSGKLDDHKCSCTQFSKSNNCSHLVACYLLLRRSLLEEKDKPQPKKKNTRRKNSKSISEIVKNVNSADLFHFVNHYAKIDKKFSTAIKVHFLSQGKNIGEDDIQNILDSIIPPLSSTKKTLSTSEWSLFTRTLEDFIAQSKDAITVSKFELASNLLLCSMTKLYYIIYKFDSREAPAISHLNKFIAQTKLFFEAIEAPITRNKFSKKFIAIHEKSYFTCCVPYDVIHVLLEEELLTPKIRTQVSEELYDFTYETEKNRIHQLSLVFRLAAFSQKLLDHYLSMAAKTISAKVLSEIFAEKDTKCIKAIIESKTNYLTEVLKDEYTYSIALEENDFKSVFKALKNLLQANKDVKYFDQAKSFNPQHISNAQLNEMIKIMETWTEKERLDLYVSLGELEKLQSSLININDLKTTFDYDQHFGESDEELLYALYINHLSIHLENHVGTQSSEITSQILRHIQSTKERALYLRVVEYTLEAFGDRKSIKTIIDFS